MAVALYDEAFGGKLRPFMPQRLQRRRVLLASFDSERAFSALEGEELLGIVGFQERGRSLTGHGSFAILRRELGWLGALRAAFGLALFDRTADEQQLLLDGICVARQARGRGVGTALLRAVCNHARASGYASVRLDVVDTNPRARRLYEREGFTATASRQVPWHFPSAGFSAFTTMVKHL